MRLQTIRLRLVLFLSPALSEEARLTIVYSGCTITQSPSTGLRDDISKKSACYPGYLFCARRPEISLLVRPLKAVIIRF